MRASGLALMISMAAATSACVKRADAVTAFTHQTLHVSNYKRADADLNGDGRLEALLYVTGQGACGSGGCRLVILSPKGSSYQVVLRSTVTQLPVTLLPTSTQGWRDVGVTVSGGGIIRPYMARLRFNGHHYPSNPTVPPAVPLKQPSGQVLIGR